MAVRQTDLVVFCVTVASCALTHCHLLALLNVRTFMSFFVCAVFVIAEPNAHSFILVIPSHLCHGMFADYR